MITCMERTMTPQTPSLRSASLVIAIDGPAASGKGTLAERIAKALNIRYLDTGKLYRTVALKLLNAGKEMDDVAAAVHMANSITEEDLSSTHLYDEHVGASASLVSAIPEVRQALLDFQRDFAKEKGGAVLDGRDIGTVVCPNATVKLFVTASLETRAQRRYEELKARGMDVTPEGIASNLNKRDTRDSKRTVAPLMAAEDAIHIDTTLLSIDEAFEAAMAAIRQKRAE